MHTDNDAPLIPQSSAAVKRIPRDVVVESVRTVLGHFVDQSEWERAWSETRHIFPCGRLVYDDSVVLEAELGVKCNSTLTTASPRRVFGSFFLTDGRHARKRRSFGCGSS